MIILQDSREQDPIGFSHPYVDKVEIMKLNIGDYGVRFRDGFEPNVYFQRKSIGDLFGTFGKGYSRFKKEIIRAQESKSTLILIIEGTISKILKGYSHSTIEGITIMRKLMTLWIKHGIYFVPCKNREEVSKYVIETFIAIGKEHLRKKKLSNDS